MSIFGVFGSKPAQDSAAATAIAAKQPTKRCSTIRNMCTSLSTSARGGCTRLRDTYQGFNGVAFRQGAAGVIISLTEKTTTAFLSTGLKKFVEIGLQRRADLDFASTVSLPVAVGRAATAPTTAALVAVAAVDTVFHKVCAEKENETTWKGTLKRNVPGLLTALGTTFITGATLPETLAIYATYKAASKVMTFLKDYEKNADAKLFDSRSLVDTAKAVVSKAREVKGVVTGELRTKEAKKTS